jgi:hypothetical protein
VGEIFDTLTQFFQQEAWAYAQLETQPALQMRFQGKNGRWECYAQAREEQAQCVFYSVSPNNVPEDKRPAVAEFLTRANYGLIVGNFEMDWNDGEIRYKTSLDVEGDRLTPALVKQMVYANVLLMDQYLPGLMAVLYGHATPAQAVAQVEMQK